MKKTYVFELDGATAYGTAVSVYGPAGELFADYVTEPGESGAARHVSMDYILGGEAIAKRTAERADGATVEVSVHVKYLHRNHMNQVIDPEGYTVAAGAGTMQGEPFASGGDGQFQGHKDDPETGLHYNIARMYNPATARWTTPDPLEGDAYVPQSLNKYAYNMNDPMNMVDMDGRFLSAVNASAYYSLTDLWFIEYFLRQISASSSETFIPPAVSYSGGGYAPPVELTTAQLNVNQSTVRIKNDYLSKENCAQAIGASTSANALTQFGNINITYNAMGYPASQTNNAVTVAQYTGSSKWSDGTTIYNITVNYLINWNDPTKQRTDAGTTATVDLIGMLKNQIGVSTINHDQFVDMMILHEFSHAIGVLKHDSSGQSNAAYNKTIWDACFK
ncbi:MAG: RHS repeat-associated core domain-containing protein [Acidobacteriota bacterium]|nr:RHS repeat-associated core domain-containing protein [Acidobacteriota bacterium]